MKYFAIAALLNSAYATEVECTAVEDCTFDKDGAAQYCGKRESCTTAEKNDAKSLFITATAWSDAYKIDKVKKADDKLEGCVWNYGWGGYGGVRHDCKAAADCFNDDDTGMYCAKIASCKIAGNNSDG